MKTSLATSPTGAQFSPLLFAGDLPKALERAAALGYNGVELNLRDSTEIDQDRVLDWARKHNLGLPSIGTGQSYFSDRLSLADRSSYVQGKAQERLRDHILFAARAGALVVLGSIRGQLENSSPAARRAGHDAAVDSTRALAAFAAEHGVRLVVEPINRYETNFLNTVHEALEFLEAVGAENVGLLVDTFHMNIEEASMTLPVLAAGERLWHVHLVDSNRRAVGMGHLDFRPILVALREIGFTGYLSAEILPLPDDEGAAETWMQGIRGLCAQA